MIEATGLTKRYGEKVAPWRGSIVFRGDAIAALIAAGVLLRRDA